MNASPRRPSTWRQRRLASLEKLALHVLDNNFATLKLQCPNQDVDSNSVNSVNNNSNNDKSLFGGADKNMTQRGSGNRPNIGKHSSVVATFETGTPCRNDTTAIRYPTMTNCSSQTTLDSTTILMTARAFAKNGQQGRAWEALEALLLWTPHSNGLLPDRSALFDDLNEPKYESRFVSALPLQASVVLEVYAWSNQSGVDTRNLAKAFPILYRHHQHLHTQRGRFGFNVLHPSELPLVDSRLDEYWNKALFSLKQQMKRNGFNDTDIFPGLTPTVLHYLNECHTTNSTVSTMHAGTDTRISFGFPHKKDKNHQQPHTDSPNTTIDLIGRCPFAVQDAAYSALWAHANAALHTMAHVLSDKHLLSDTVQLDQLEEWAVQSRQQMETLWNPQQGRYLSKTLYHRNDTDEWLTTRDASSFVSMWHSALNQSWVDSIVYSLLRPDEFDCGTVPLWSVGYPCGQNSTISPFLNYLVGSGLKQNHAHAMGNYVMNSTLETVCETMSDGHDGPLKAERNFWRLLDEQGDGDNRNNDDDDDDDEGPTQGSDRSKLPTCTSDIVFAEYYGALSMMPILTTDACPGSVIASSPHTLTAAVVYNSLTPDLPINFTETPPLRTSWVIVLIVVELIVAFSIGVGCLVMSLRMSRILRRSIQNNPSNGLGGLDDRSMDEATQEYYAAYETLSEYGDDDGHDNNEEQNGASNGSGSQDRDSYDSDDDDNDDGQQEEEEEEGSEYDVSPDDITEPTSSGRRRRQR